MALVTKRDVHEAFLSSSSSSSFFFFFFFFFFFPISIELSFETKDKWTHRQNTCLKTPSMFHS
jgi:hypothetical protein